LLPDTDKLEIDKDCRMTLSEPSGLYYPNRIARAFFAAMDDVMGQNGLSQLLGLADMTAYMDTLPPDNLKREFDFAAIAALNTGLEKMYGVRGGRGMALRIGQSAFSRGLKDFGALRGINSAAFRVLPLEKRIDYGLHGFAAVLTNFSDQACTIESEGNALLFISDESPFSWNRTSEKPVCHMMVGMILECLRWSSNGYEFYVRETHCRAAGHSQCIFRINKSAIGERAR
jgi:hypothetical protein